MRQPQTAVLKRTHGKIVERQARGDRRRAEIMVAAEEIFLEKGYGNATVDDIAARAGASKATMYKWFGNKETMFAEIVRSRAPDIAYASSEALRANGTLTAILINWAMQVLKLVTTPRSVALFKLILAESPRSPELVQIFYEKGPGTAQAHLADFFRRANAAGKMRCSDPELAARLFISAAFGEGFERALIGLADEKWAQGKGKIHVKEAVAMFLARYGA